MTLMLDLQNNTHAALASCYDPTMTASKQEKDDFYDFLCDVISGIKHKDKLVPMSDFNARVGADHVTWEGVLGVSQCGANEFKWFSSSFDLQ